MRALDLCAGAGGLSAGLGRAGFDVLGVELDEDAHASHLLNAGPCDLADLAAYEPAGVFDVIAGGVPCQPFSEAGDRGGLLDERGALFEHLPRLGRAARARALLLENVPGLLTWRDVEGRGMALYIARAFEAAGFSCRYQVLNAADYGVPQFRKRVFFIGFRDPGADKRFRWPAPTHGPPGNLFGLPAWRTVREALGLGLGLFEAGRLEGAAGWQGMRRLDVDAPSPTVGGSMPELLSPLDRPAPTLKANSYREGRGARRSQRPMGELASLLDRPSATITAGGGAGHTGGAEPLCNQKYRRDLSAELREAGLLERPATTVTARAKGTIAKAGHHRSNQDGAVRLSVDQCAALQDLAGWRFQGTKESQHRQVGNAVPPLLALALGQSMHFALETS